MALCGMGGFHRFVWLGVVFFPFAFTQAAKATPPKTVELEKPLTSQVEVERVIWPVELKNCPGLTPDQVQVSEDGDPVVRVERIEREQPPAMHVLLLDASGSMDDEDRLTNAKLAANDYISRLADGMTVMVYSFDDTLQLQVPAIVLAADNREPIRQAVDRISAGNLTMLRDALYQVLLYLSQRSERAALIVLTDGYDTGSLYAEDPLLRWVAEKPGQALAIFPIGLSVPEMFGVTPFLQALARNSGGKIYFTNYSVKLLEIFQEIQDYLQGRVFIVYEAKPWGEGGRDPKKNGEDQGWRKVLVKTSRKDCTITPLKKKRWLLPEKKEVAEAHLADSAAASPLPRKNASLPATQPVTLPVGYEWVNPIPSLDFVYDKDHQLRYLIGRHVPDFIIDWGYLYSSRVPWMSRRNWVQERERSCAHVLFYDPGCGGIVRGWREVHINIPPLVTTQRYFQTPEALFWNWLVAPDQPLRQLPLTVDHIQTILPLIMHSHAFSLIRHEVAQVIYAASDEYRQFVDHLWQEKIQQRWQQDFGDLPAEQQKYLRGQMQQAPPPAKEISSWLADWLGDIRARDLAMKMETMGVQYLLAAEGETRPLILAQLQRLVERWPILRDEWFPQPTRVHKITLLQLAYDPQRQRFGFYSVLFPRPRLEKLPLDLIEAQPLATRFWLAAGANPQVMHWWAQQGFRLLSFEYVKPGAAEVVDIKKKWGEHFQRLDMALATKRVKDGQPLHLRVWYALKKNKIARTLCFDFAEAIPEVAEQAEAALAVIGLKSCAEASKEVESREYVMPEDR